VRPFQFGVRLVPPPHPVALLAHCADAVVEHDPAARETRVHFDRNGSSLGDVVVSALRDVAASGLTAAQVVPDDDLITLAAVAARVGTSRRVVEGLLHGGPPPLWHCADEPVYRWPEVAPRLREAGDPASERIFEAANLALRLRALTRDDAALTVLTRIVDG
jgi:hypothetical protein